MKMNGANPTPTAPDLIKAAMLLKGFSTVTVFAAALDERRDTVSAVICQLRNNKRVQAKIEDRLDIEFEEIRAQAASPCKGKRRLSRA